jgi:hypothetical protein
VCVSARLQPWRSGYNGVGKIASVPEHVKTPFCHISRDVLVLPAGHVFPWSRSNRTKGTFADLSIIRFFGLQVEKSAQASLREYPGHDGFVLSVYHDFLARIIVSKLWV